MLLERVVLPITNTFSAAKAALAFSSDKTIGAWAIAPSKTKGSSAISGAAKSLANFSISATLNPARSWPITKTPVVSSSLPLIWFSKLIGLNFINARRLFQSPNEYPRLKQLLNKLSPLECFI